MGLRGKKRLAVSPGRLRRPGRDPEPIGCRSEPARRSEHFPVLDMAQDHAARIMRIVGQHYRNLRREEYLPGELPAYSRYLVLVPCLEHCGVSPEPLPSTPAQVGPYRRLWNWIKHTAGHVSLS